MANQQGSTDNKASNEKGMRAYGILTAVGLELIILILAAYFLGKWLDGMWGTKGISIAFLIFVAFGLWLVLLLKALKKLENNDK